VIFSVTDNDERLSPIRLYYCPTMIGLRRAWGRVHVHFRGEMCSRYTPPELLLSPFKAIYGGVWRSYRTLDPFNSQSFTFLDCRFRAFQHLKYLIGPTSPGDRLSVSYTDSNPKVPFFFPNFRPSLSLLFFVVFPSCTQHVEELI